MLESGIALIAACLPTLQYVIVRKLAESTMNSVGRLLSSRAQSSKSSMTLDERPYLGIPASRSQKPTARTKHESYEPSQTALRISDEGHGDMGVEDRADSYV